MPALCARTAPRRRDPFSKVCFPKASSESSCAGGFLLDTGDVFGLLWEIGRDCAGAVSLLPADEVGDANPLRGGRHRRGQRHQADRSRHPCRHPAGEASPPPVAESALGYHAGSVTATTLVAAAALAAVLATVPGAARPPAPAPARVLEPVASPSPSPPPARPLPAPGRQVGLLAADSLQLLGLRSLTVGTAETAAGPVRFIELAMRASTIGAMDLRLPCVGGLQVRQSAAQARVSGLTLRVTALQVTALTVPLTLVAAELPDGRLTLPGVSLPPLPADTQFLAVRMLVLSMTAVAMAMDASRVATAGC
jgi:hypothetical protein